MRRELKNTLSYESLADRAPHSVVAVASFGFAVAGATALLAILLLALFGATANSGDIAGFLEPLSLICAILGIALSFLANRDDHQCQTFGTWGFYLGLVVLAVFGLWWIFC
jgi:hypothetical protein